MKEKLLLVLILVLAFSLRFYKVDLVPPGLYQDEPPIGVHAYSLLTTGKGENGERLFFESFSDPRMPAYIYATAVSIAVFGNTDLALRFPSVLAGTFTVLIFYLFLSELMKLDKNLSLYYKKRLPLLSALILAILPWHIQFSRAGFEATVALFLFLLGNYFFLKFFRKKQSLYLVLSSFFIALAAYSYNAYRLIAPINFMALSLYFVWKFPKERGKMAAVYIFFGLVLAPLFLFSLSPGGEKRFAATSAFSQVAELSIWQKIYITPSILIKNYLSFFSPSFLFDVGDGIGRHQMPNFGNLLKWQLPFLLFGSYFLLRLRHSSLTKNFLIFLIIISPVAAFITLPSPHGLRSLSLVIPLSAVIALGILFFIQKYSQFAKPVIFGLVFVATCEFLFYLHYYYVHYPKVNLLDWGGGMKETVFETQKLSPDYDLVVIDSELKFSRDYFKYYFPNFSFISADSVAAENLGKEKRVLYITHAYGGVRNQEPFYEIKLNNVSKDIYSKFYSL